MGRITPTPRLLTNMQRSVCIDRVPSGVAPSLTWLSCAQRCLTSATVRLRACRNNRPDLAVSPSMPSVAHPHQGGACSVSGASVGAALLAIQSIPERWSRARLCYQSGTWCSGITPAQHAGGPGFNPQCVHCCIEAALPYASGCGHRVAALRRRSSNGRAGGPTQATSHREQRSSTYVYADRKHTMVYMYMQRERERWEEGERHRERDREI